MNEFWMKLEKLKRYVYECSHGYSLTYESHVEGASLAEEIFTKIEATIAAQAKEIEQLRRLAKPFMDAFDEEEGKL